MSRVVRIVVVLTLCQAFLFSPSFGGLGARRCFAAEAVPLKDQLEKGLKARRPVEFEFIAQVVHLVEMKKLDRKLVDGTFLWARRKPKHVFQYFEHAMRVRAKKAGVTLK